MSKTRPVWPASAALPADGPRQAEWPGSLRHALALREASAERACRRLGQADPNLNPHPNPNPKP
eukprot:scaffold126933_cov30-Phaeocystis_antarctica.AAC.1